MTQIEKALFLDGTAHCVRSFELSSDTLVMMIHPWERAQAAARAFFPMPHIVSVDDSYADGQQKLPWDIIGFDSEPLVTGRWRFCLHTDCIEYVFESAWPEIFKTP